MSDGSDLANLIRDSTVVLVGQSGVGKSSLIQRLLPDASIRVGALSELADKGRHTTTTAELFHLPNGGRLIDSPGVREFGLGHVTPAEIALGFREFSPFLGRCRFRDCHHEREPDCALRAAVTDGSISEARFESYLQIRQSVLDAS
jgi:ribosome biogenesis GTPase